VQSRKPQPEPIDPVEQDLTQLLPAKCDNLGTDQYYDVGSQVLTMQTAILYDGQCLVCQQSVALIRRLDRTHAILPIDLHDKSALAPYAPQLDLSDSALMHEIHVLTTDGKVLSGYGGMRAIAQATPLTRWFAPIMGWPGIAWLGARTYNWVAAHRYQINRLFGVEICTDGACALPAKAKR